MAERINTLLHHPTTISSLNVGTATGTTSDMLTQFRKVMLVEHDEDCCNYIQPLLSTPLIQGSITELPFENDLYDLVCAFDVIEHVEDDQKAIVLISLVIFSSAESPTFVIAVTKASI